MHIVSRHQLGTVETSALRRLRYKELLESFYLFCHRQFNVTFKGTLECGPSLYLLFFFFFEQVSICYPPPFFIFFNTYFLPFY